MTLRTPRRRVSLSTKRKYRAIKNFLRRALGTQGTSSQPDTKTSSSIVHSISNTQSKITSLEQQWSKFSEHCRESTPSEHNLQRNSGSLENTTNADLNVNEDDSELLHQSSNSQRRTYGNNNSVSKHRYDDSDKMMSASTSVAPNYQDYQPEQKVEIREKKRNRNDIELLNQRRHSKYKIKQPIYSTSSFHSFVDTRNNYIRPECSNQPRAKRYHKKEYTEPLISKEHRDRETVKKVLRNARGYDDKHKRTKRVYSELDKDFIANIIKRQYRPVKIFGRKDSDFSQFSAPVCRDQEFTARGEIQEGIELCSCCFDECRRKRNRYIRYNDLSDMRSICDTRLYSSKNKVERHYIDDYNNSALYDVVPVKEKSSPKTRKKITENNTIIYRTCKEVPPSPRSNRPRLNLKVQHYEDYDDSLRHKRIPNKRKSPMRAKQKVLDALESDISSGSYPLRIQTNLIRGKAPKPVQTQEDVGTMSSLHYANFANDQAILPNTDTTLNTQLTDSATDKTDKTLSEIKDILESFLLEIKNESMYNDKSEGTSKMNNDQVPQNQEYTKTKSNVLPSNGDSFNNNSARQCCVPPFLPSFANQCCYPMIPVYPMNCTQNGYVIPSPSYTCNLCAKDSKENNKNISQQEVTTNNETQDLIKEIYKFVSQKTKPPQTAEYDNETNGVRSKNERFQDKKFVTGRYVDGNTKASKHDANVGTPHLMCYSKSCEAIGSRVACGTYNTNSSYSDTVLERLSFEATQSSTETTLSTDVPEQKVKTKTTKLYNPLRLFRKKPKNVIEEKNENESTAEVEVKSKPPFQQHIQSYAMHGQQYFHPPPGQQCCYGCCERGLSTNDCPSPQPSPIFYNHHKPHLVHSPTHYCNPKHPSAPPHPNHDLNCCQAQVPLCLKEIEVKSIAIQSDRKVSILQKLAKRRPAQPQQEKERIQSTAPMKGKTNFWKSLQEKTRQNDNATASFSLKTQNRLEQGDTNMRDAIMKKIFYKRNPFSPRNLIVRTLLGKDKSSFGNPPKMYRPRMFV